MGVDGRATADLGYGAVENLLDGRAGTSALVQVRKPNGVARTVRLARKVELERPVPAVTGIFAFQQDTSLIVDQVSPGSAAARAGGRSGDEILAVDGHSVTSLISGSYLDASPAQSVLTLRRQGKGAPRAVQLATAAAGKKSK